MPFPRIFDGSLPPLSTIQEIEGPFIVDAGGGAGIVAAKVGVVCMIGETLKGTPNMPTEIVSGGDFLDLFGGFLPAVGDGAALSYDGNALVALAGHKFARLVVVSVDDRVGEVDLARAAPGNATMTSTNAGPYALADNDTFIVAIEGPVVDGTVTIQATAASVLASNAEVYDLTIVADRTLTLAVNGGPTQSATITAGDVVAINAVTAEEIRDWANGAFTGVSVGAAGAIAAPTFTTDRKGLSASMLFGGGMRSKLGLSASLIQSSQLAADNTVQDVDAVTVDELVDLLNVQLSDVTAENVGGFLRLTRDAAGASATMTLSGLIPGIDPAGKVKFATSLTAAGGTDTAPAGTIFAGTRISDGGSNIFFLAEDATFAAGVLTATGVKIRQYSGGTVLAGAIDTFVDTPDTTAFVSPTVTNGLATTAKPASESAWLVKYQAAIDTLLAAGSPEADVNILLSARHGVSGVAISALTGKIAKAMTDHSIAATLQGTPRIAIVSPPVGATKAQARGSSGIGVSSTTMGGRHKRRVYAWPGYSKQVNEIVSNDQTLDGVIDWPSDVLVATKASLILPEESLAQPGDELRAMLAMETYYQADGTGGKLTIDDYKANKAAGICGPIMDATLGPVIQSSVTSVDPESYPDDAQISDRRFRDFLFVTLLKFARPKQSKTATRNRQAAVMTDLAGFLKDMRDSEPQRIVDYAVKDATPASMKGRGVFMPAIAVQFLDHFDNIGFRVTGGRTVDVTQLN